MDEVGVTHQEIGLAGFWARYRLLIIAGVVVLGVIVWLYLSKSMALKRVEEGAAAQRTALLKQVDARQTDMVKQSLILFSMPLAWAIRREMMADNLDQVDQYVTELVKQKGIELVAVAKADGVIAVASDRKQLGTALGTLYDKRYLSAEQVSVEETAPGQWLMVVPVMGMNARLGTVVVEYRATLLPLSK
jgi:hypothetical protein